jgi:hypothetical protein
MRGEKGREMVVQRDELCPEGWATIDTQHGHEVQLMDDIELSNTIYHSYELPK